MIDVAVKAAIMVQLHKHHNGHQLISTSANQTKSSLTYWESNFCSFVPPGADRTSSKEKQILDCTFTRM